MKAVAEKRVGLTYDAASQAATLSRYANLAGTQVVAHTEYDFDLAGRLRGMEHFKGGTTFADYDWTYDAAGRMTAFDSLVDGTAGYTNDATGQLTGADYDYQADETYVYDENGNRVNNGYTVGANNQMTSDGTYRYLYDAEGNRTRRFVDTNANGLPDSGDTDVTEYTWDHRNRLTGVTHRAQYGAAADMVVENSYDFANRWVRKLLDDDGDGTRDYTRVFAYDGNQIVLDFHRNGPCGMQGGHLRERYLWGPAVDQILAEEAVNGGSAEHVLWTLTDHLNTVRDLARYVPGTDTTTVLNHLAYNAFGEVTSETNAAVDSLFLFTARPFDEDTGLQNNLNRWYDPAVGRWLSEDPIGYEARDPNLYRYVDNRPTNSFDPLGLQVVDYPLIPCNRCHPWPGHPDWNEPPPAPTTTYCGMVSFTCCDKKTYEWPVYGNSVEAGILTSGIGGKGCVTLGGRISCTMSCAEIKSAKAGPRSGPGYPSLDHEACHACALLVNGLTDYVYSAVADLWDGYCKQWSNTVPTTPKW
ncbi:MAG: RHS repeat-associated core domain-containing protein [Candidatus Hydrogenedentes bacterium]|nr:RHS repeat-associated core domain-containing protein [Candidatus Hydrogenedentota bacterium]